MSKFDKDLQTGAQAEKYIVGQLATHHKGLRRVKVKSKDYDLVAADGYTAEVKFDILSQKTHNIGIEYECSGKKSGIACTKAMDWVHIYKLGNDWVYSVVSTNDLKSFLKSNWEFLSKVKGGDNSASRMVLVPTLDFVDTFSFHPIYFSEGSSDLQ